ncbi:MAG: ATP-binding protein [Desulfobulbaceae bacterium]|nr:ATP-binding protein [Desulfobulbaceae bacterium]
MSIFTIFRKIKPVTDSEEQLRAHLLWYLFIRVILFTLLIGITLFLQSSERQVILPSQLIIFLFLIFIYTYSILSALFLKKKSLLLRRFGKIQVCSDTLFISLLVYATGGTQSIFTPVYILPILGGGLIMHRIGGLIPAAAATLLYGGVLGLEYMQFIPAYFHDYRYTVITEYQVSTSIFALYGLIFFLIALLSGLLARKLRTAEDALSRSEMKYDQLLLLYKQIFDDIITGIITLDSAGRITSFNPAAASITGYAPEEVTGRLCSLFFPGLVTDKRDRQVTDFRKKDGKKIRIGYTCSKLHMTSSDQVGDPPFSSNRVITLQDVSKIEKMEQQMRHAEKMAAIGELSASIAHDFRNPLAAISGSAQILAMDKKSDADTYSITDRNLTAIILRESERMANTITDFLHYAQPVNPQPQQVNLFDLVHETIDQLVDDRQECSDCIIETDVPEDIDVEADAQLLQLALSHVLRNSCYAAGESSMPVVCSARMEGESRETVIEIADHGSGIEPSIQDRVFEPFFTTRQDSAGLGLAIVQQIIASHGGKVEIISAANQGCRVIIRLPPGPPIR